MSIKKIICILLVVLVLAACAACGNSKTTEKTDKTTSAAEEATTAPAAATNAVTPAPAETTADGEVTAPVTVIPGVLTPLNLKDDEEPVITALRLVGNRAGTENGVNGKEPSTEKIRSAFELNEWIEVTPVTAQENGLFAYIVPHSEDPGSYTEAFIAALSDTTPKAELVKPEEDGACWGSLYANPDDWQAGDYDLVIVSGVKPVACVMIKLYNADELAEKTDAEIEALMTADSAQ